MSEKLSKINYKRFPTYFLSHGGGPWSYMQGKFRKGFATLEAFLNEMSKNMSVQPKAIIVISGHWEEKDFAVMSSPNPSMVYDYGGFPEETYKIKYSSSGSPELAKKVSELIISEGLPTHFDNKRGYDHGTYSLLNITHPEANIPVIQVSMQSGYDPENHIKLGRALSPLRDDGVLIIGSGMSHHNSGSSNVRESSAQFDSWLHETLVKSSPEERIKRLVEWEKAPYARDSHRYEDHLVPLFVMVGAAENEEGKCVYHDNNFFGMATISSFSFG